MINQVMHNLQLAITQGMQSGKAEAVNKEEFKARMRAKCTSLAQFASPGNNSTINKR